MRALAAIFWVLAIFWLQAERLTAQSTPTATLPWPEQVQGFGRTLESAQKDAVAEALKQVAAYLARLDPPLAHWQPGEDYLRRHILAGPGRAGADVDIPGLGTARTWVLDLQSPDLAQWTRLDHDAQSQARHGDRIARAEERLKFAGRIGAGLAGLMVLAWVYGRWRRSR